MLRQFSRTAVLFATLPSLTAARSGIIQVTGARTSSYVESTRVTIEFSGSFVYRSDRAHNPERLFIDIPEALPYIANRRFMNKEIGDARVRRIRIAENAPYTTRIVFDLAAPTEFTVTKLEAPYRMVIEFRSAGAKPRLPVEITSIPPKPEPLTLQPYVPSRAQARRTLSSPALAWPTPPTLVSSADLGLPEALALPEPAEWTKSQTPAAKPLIVRGAAAGAPALPQVSYQTQPPVQTSPPVSGTPAAQTPGTTTQVLPATKPLTYDAAPRASENATRSLTRALGLKINRIVIDAGHGGHDDGTIGPHGVLEKDVVLDVALRLARVVQERMGAEVVLTRSDDTFIPLNERTAVANQHKGDLFVSIHANSSPAPEVAGTETFFLNLAPSPGATETAARENAGSDKTVGELKDLIQSITMNDKIEESRTFAEYIQSAMQAQASRTNPNAHNRGVKKAPFVVLIGASMPSILAEIGFLSNLRDEANLNKPAYRQKVAEALYKGISQYVQSLSHFDTPKQLATK